MLPSQILLNNLLYDTSQLAIPTDNVDEEQLRRPSHWDIAFIRRFMLVFGPLSSVFDFATFGVMLWVFHSGPTSSAPAGSSNPSPVGAENAVTSCDLHVLVHETAEPVASEGLDDRAGGRGSAAGGRVLIK